MRYSVLLTALLLSAAPGEFEARRAALVDQLRSDGIRNERVLAAISAVPRHAFVPAGWRELAYQDTPLPIGLGQTISQPWVVAAMTELLDPHAGDRILEIGTGSGYQAAVLARLVRRVYTIELEPDLARSAANRLRELGYTNVIVKQGDGYRGWPGEAPFDGIIVTAAPSEIPRVLLDELRPQGRLVAPVGTDDQWLKVLTKQRNGRVISRTIAPVRFVPMRHGAEK